MGKGWKKAGKIETAQKKGARFTKLAKEISVATKLGGPDPESNARLRMAIASARDESCPKDTIERAIKKGAGLSGDDNIEEVMYEGFGPHNVGVLVICQTDNRNRTVPELKVLFRKYGGSLGEIGSVAWMFDRCSMIEGVPTNPINDPEEEAIEVGANEVEAQEDQDQIQDQIQDNTSFCFYGVVEDLDIIRSALTKRGWNIKSSELAYKAKNTSELSETQKNEVIEFLQTLDDHDDTHRIYATLKN